MTRLQPLLLVAALLGPTPARPCQTAPHPAPAHVSQEEPPEEGVVITRYPSGQLKERYEVDEEGTKSGSFEAYTEGGQLVLSCGYREGKLDGPYRTFNQSGEPLLETGYNRGQEHGARREYEGGVIRSKRQFKRSVLDGPMEDYDDQGREIRSCKYRRGKLNGKLTESRPDEKWERVVAIKDDVLDGKGKITVKGKTVSKRTWKRGLLVKLDGIEPFPLSEEQLAAEFAEAVNVGSPDPDDPKSPVRLKELARLRQYRALCRVPFRELHLDPELNSLCDAAGVLLEAHGELSHTPPKPPEFDDEAYLRGYLGTSSSNLFGIPLGKTVDGYMDDSDSTNIDRVGHRRWCLNPPMERTGFGGKGRWSAMWSFDDSGSGRPKSKAILYPPAGYAPKDMFGPRHAWSVTLQAGSTMPAAAHLDVVLHELDTYYQPIGEPLALDYKGVNAGSGSRGDCLFFRPKGLRVAPDKTYRATITEKGDKRPLFDYVVQFTAEIEPAAEGD